MVDKKPRKKRTVKKVTPPAVVEPKGVFALPTDTPVEPIVPAMDVTPDPIVSKPEDVVAEPEEWQPPVMETIKVKPDGAIRRDFAVPKNPGLNVFLAENTEEGRNKMRRLGYDVIPASEIISTDGVVMKDEKTGQNVVIFRDRVAMACRKEYSVERDHENIKAHRAMDAKREQQIRSEAVDAYEDDGRTSRGKLFSIPFDMKGGD